MPLSTNDHSDVEGADTIPFPDLMTRPAAESHQGRRQLAPSSADDAAQAFESVSRQMKDLARELNCLGYFDDDDDDGDPPRAA